MGVNRSAVILAMIVAMLGLMAITAHADSMISGDIGFGSFGKYTLTGGTDLGNNTGFQFQNKNNAIISIGTGDFANFDPDTGIWAGTFAQFKSFSFNAQNANVITPGTELWTFTDPNGKTYTLEMLTATVTSRNANFLEIDGTCVFDVTGFAPTEGTFTFEASSTGKAFTFDSNAGAIPEISTFVLLCGGLTGLGLFRRGEKKS